MIKRTFKMTIKVDEKKLKKNYPNFDINYSSVEDFINRAILNLQVCNVKEFGYGIKIEKEVIQNEKI